MRMHFRYLPGRFWHSWLENNYKTDWIDDRNYLNYETTDIGYLFIYFIDQLNHAIGRAVHILH